MIDPKDFGSSIAIDINNFNLMCPHEAYDVVGVRRGNKDTLIFTTVDDNEIIWNCYTNRIEIPKNNSELSDLNEMDEDSWNKIFGKRLKQQMMSVGITQATLSRLTNITQSTVSKYCSGEVIPTAMNLVKIARVLKCDVNDLVNF